MGQRELDRVRKIALALPEVKERLSHGAPCFFVRDKRPLCYFHDDDFSDDGRVSLWCPAPPGVPEELVFDEPERFFRPTPSASGVYSDWLGVFLDSSDPNEVDWDEVKAHLTRSSGSLINIASMTSYFGSARMPGYSSSKGAIVQLTKSLAIAWAGDNIRVNAIAPGWIESNLTLWVPETRSWPLTRANTGHL